MNNETELLRTVLENFIDQQAEKSITEDQKNELLSPIFKYIEDSDWDASTLKACDKSLTKNKIKKLEALARLYQLTTTGLLTIVLIVED